jgi:hypothetical protein
MAWGDEKGRVRDVILSLVSLLKYRAAQLRRLPGSVGKDASLDEADAKLDTIVGEMDGESSQ